MKKANDGSNRLRLPMTFEEALGDLLKVKPPEKGEKKPVPKRGSRKGGAKSRRAPSRG
jgi:hypothetical protein